jgi:hypothetical protein
MNQAKSGVSHWAWIILAVTVWAGFSGQTAGQASSSSLRGTITDPQGAVVPNVNLRLVHLETGAERTTTSSEMGDYAFLQVRPGVYELRAEMQGYKSYVKQNIVLPVGTPVTLNFSLEIGQLIETVTVTAEAAAINTADASVGNAFMEVQVRQLPLLTRNVVELLNLQAGVNQTGESMGGRRDQNNVTLDGADVNDNQDASPFESVLPVPLDSVQEFRVTTVGFNAEAGRSSGGQVALITKSGSNALHGSAYYFHRNTATAANSWFNNRAGVKRPFLLRHQYGASLGGPIKKDKVFYFYNYEERRDSSAYPVARTVPSETFKQGIIQFYANDGSLQVLTPGDIKMIDPQGIGPSPAMLELFRSHPPGNDNTMGDQGLNHTGLRFAAPAPLNHKAHVARIDIPFSANHTFFWRGTLADRKEIDEVALFPGGSPRTEFLDNSKGFAAQYAAVITPRLVNNLTWGLTRIGYENTGAAGPSFFVPSTVGINTNSSGGPLSDRAFSRTNPVHSIVNTTSWMRGNHTIKSGINFRFIHNARNAFRGTFPHYRSLYQLLLGTGREFIDATNRHIQQRSGNPALAVSPSWDGRLRQDLTNMLGIIADAFITFNADKSGQFLPIGKPVSREFTAREYDFFVEDSWKVTPSLTVTAGLRYSIYPSPFEANGNQVATTTSLWDYWDQRRSLGPLGVPGTVQGGLTYDLSGPANGKPSWFNTDKNNFAPRFSFAYAPAGGGGWLGKLIGGRGTTSFRGGYGVMYSRYGSGISAQFDQQGSVGMTTTVGLDRAYRASDAPRYDGRNWPQPTTPPSGKFPFTPPDNKAISMITTGISERLVAPYSHMINASVARQLPGNTVLEAGYAGRLGRKLVAVMDIANPLINMVDPQSGQSWSEAMMISRNLVNSGFTESRIEANPGAVPLIPFVERYFAGLRNRFVQGSATANHVYVHNWYGPSEADMTEYFDRQLCASTFGCYSFFQRQFSSIATWTNEGFSSYHAMLVTFRKPFSRGLSFDFNYTWSKSIDNVRGQESANNIAYGAWIENPFKPGDFRAPSSYDIRQQFNANFFWDLPLGRGKRFGSSMPLWAEQAFGNWQLSGIVRGRTGLGTQPFNDYYYPTSYWIDTMGMVGDPSIRPKKQFTKTNEPSIFADPSEAASKMRYTNPGESSAYNVIRRPGMYNVDLAIGKSFRTIREGHRVQFRAELFNALNHVNFDFPYMNPFADPDRFGILLGTSTGPRVIQFGLRYDF